MFDVLYVAGTLLFFALMLAYVRLCAAMGRSGDAPAPEARH